MTKLLYLCIFLTLIPFKSLAKTSASFSNGTTSVTQGSPNPNCPQFQVFGYPTTTNAKILRRAFYTCRLGYAALYDPYERTPLWVAEHLVKENLNGVADRDGLSFFADPDIPVGALPKLSVYSSSGYDKGHMAPAGDFKSSQSAMIQSFQFGNAVPQSPESNRHIWKALEETTRELAGRRGELYVVTGPVYSTAQRLKLKNSVSIPDSTFKILIDPKSKTMTGFVIPNNSTPGNDFRLYQFKVREIEKMTGLDFNSKLNRDEADRLEAVNGGDWLMPRPRDKVKQD